MVCIKQASIGISCAITLFSHMIHASRNWSQNHAYTIYLIKFVLIVHVDDLLGGCNSDPFYKGLIQHFKKTVKIQEKGIPTQMLQMKLDWNLALSIVSTSQERQIMQLYIKYVGLENKKMFDSPMDPKLKIIKGDPNNLPEVEYLNLIGALYFIARMSRPDVYYVVNALSRMNACYTMEHWRYLLRVLIYLYHTKDQHLTYRRADIDKTKPVTNLQYMVIQALLMILIMVDQHQAMYVTIMVI